MPYRHRTGLVVLAAAAALVIGACEAEEGGGDGAAASALAEQGPIVRTAADATTPFVLAKGLYRVAWKTTDCPSITVELVGDNGYSKKQTSTVPNHTFIATGVDDGNYTVAQTDAACATWEVSVTKIGG